MIDNIVFLGINDKGFVCYVEEFGILFFMGRTLVCSREMSCLVGFILYGIVVLVGGREFTCYSSGI